MLLIPLAHPIWSSGFKPVQRLTTTTRNKRLTLTYNLLTQLCHIYPACHQFRRSHLSSFFLHYTCSTISLHCVFNYKSHYTYKTDYTVLPPNNTATLLLHFPYHPSLHILVTREDSELHGKAIISP